MVSFRDRVEQRIKDLDTNPFEAARAGGLERNFINDIVSGRKVSVRGENLRKVAIGLQTTQNWLLTGDGGHGETADPDDRPTRTKSSAGHNHTLMPGAIAEVDLRAGAGGGGFSLPAQTTDGRYTYSAEHVRDEWVLPQRYIRDELRVSLGQVEIIAVDGDSMIPVLHSGDRVLVNRADTNIRQGGVFAVREGDAVIVKHIELIRGSEPPRIRCSSANAQYNDFELVLGEDADIIGRVVWRATRM